MTPAPAVIHRSPSGRFVVTRDDGAQPYRITDTWTGRFTRAERASRALRAAAQLERWKPAGAAL